MFQKKLNIKLALVVLILSQPLTAKNIVQQEGSQSMKQTKNQPWLEHILGDLKSSGVTDGLGKSVSFASPQSLVLDKNGNIFVSDYSSSVYRSNQFKTNSLIRKVTSQGEVSTFAGAAEIIESQSELGKLSVFRKPSGLAVDDFGNLYVADEYKNCIHKITPDKVVSTFSGVCGERGDEDGPLARARLSSPKAIAIDKNGFLYVGDNGNSSLRKISPEGVVSTLAGSSEHHGDIKDGVGTSASFNKLMALSFDSHGVLYVADYKTIRKVSAEGVVTSLEFKYKGNIAIDLAWFKGLTIDPQDNIYSINENAIYKILPTGEISLFAGNPNVKSGTNGKGALARFSEPEGLSSDIHGNVYVADSGNLAIRKITPDGTVSTLAGPTTQGVLFRTKDETQIVIDSEYNIFATGSNVIGSTINKFTPEGDQSLIPFFYMSSEIRSLAVDRRDYIYLMEQVDSDNQRGEGGGGYSMLPEFIIEFFREKGYSKICKLSSSGKLTTVVGKTSELFFDIAVDTEDNIYVASSNQLKKITPRKFWFNKTQVIIDYHTDYNIDLDDGVDSGNPSKMEFKKAFPISLITDKENNLYFIELSYTSVRRVTTSGGLEIGGRRGEGSGTHFEIKKITPNGKITVIAGSAKSLGAVDGVGASASFDFPKNLSIDSKNNLYVLESKLQTIRKIEPNGNVTTIVGQPGLNKFIEGPLPGGLKNALSITVRGSSLYIVLQNGISIVRNLP